MSEFCEIHFKIKIFTQLSEQIKILGNVPQLGSWDSNNAFALKTGPDQYPFWVSEAPIKLKKGTKLEFKCARFFGNALKQWENIPNGSNRNYRALCYKVMLECTEGNVHVNENIVQRFLSNDALPSGVVKVKKRQQNEDFNPFKDAQNFSMSDDSFTSNEIRSDLESPAIFQRTNNLESLNEEQESADENGLVLQPVPIRKLSSRNDVLKKTWSRGEELGELAINVRKPIFMEDLGKQKKLGKIVSKKSASDLKSLGGLSRVNILLRNIENRDNPFTKLHERLRADHKILNKSRNPSLIKAFDEHEVFSDQVDYRFTQTELPKSPVIMAVYRLPFNIKLIETASDKIKRWQITLSSDPYLSTIYRFGAEKHKAIKWVGWPGLDVEAEYQEELTALLREEYNAIPIFLNSEVRQKYCDEYCKKLLFNLFYNISDQSENVDQDALISTFRQVNSLFASKLIENRDSQTTIIVNDYHLLLVPHYIALQLPNQVIGFVFETSFPVLENFMTLNHKEEFLCSILCCDLIYFNTGEYVKAFFSACGKVLNLKYGTQEGGHLFLNYYGRKVFINIAKHAIEPQLVSNVIRGQNFAESLQKYKNIYPDSTLMACMTHFHPHEGLLGFLDAIQEFYSVDPRKTFNLMILQVHGRVLSEENTPLISEYQDLVKERVKEVNNALLTLGSHSSIEIIGNSLLHDCYALLSLSAILFSFSSTLTADLKALEYVAVKQTGPATIVRSEWTPGQKSLNILRKVNPNNKKQVVKVISESLVIPQVDAEFIFGLDKKLVEAHTAWQRYEHLLQNLGSLLTIKTSMNLFAFKEQERIKLITTTDHFRSLDANHVKEAFAKAKNKVIIVNYENVLVNLQAYEMRLRAEFDDQYTRYISTEHIELLKKLSKAVDNQISIMSSKRPDVLNYLYEHLSGISVFAENGFLYKIRRESAWQQMSKVDWSFKTIVQKIMQNYASKTKGAQVENKESAICWNCSEAGTQIGEIQIEELKMHLKEVLEFLEYVEIVHGNSWIEVKPLGINKGVATELVLLKTASERGPIDFVLCVGADSLDETMFSKLKNKSELVQEGLLSENSEIFSVIVGKRPSNANYYLNDTSELYSLFSKLAERDE